MAAARVTALGLLVFVCVCLPPSQLKTGSLEARERPNILFNLTDEDVGSVAGMPNVRSGLVDRGTSFDRAYMIPA